MIPYDIDPSLHSGQPERNLLDDGFSPPPQEELPPTQSPPKPMPAPPVEPVLSDKSEF
jgi:hypothetical protein